MRIVFLSHDSNHNGGAQKCLVDLLKGLKQNYPDCEVYVIFPSEGELIESCIPYISGYQVISMRWWLLNNNKRSSFKKKCSFIIKSVRKALEIRRYLRLIKPDYAITNTIVLPYLALSCKISSVRHLWFIHEVPATWLDRRFIFNLATVYKWVEFLSWKVIVPSNYAKRFYAERLSVSKINILTQAVDMDFPSVRQCVEHERYTLLLVGTFDSNKGQLELLQAIKKIVDLGRDVNCYLVGSDSGYLSGCKEYIALNKLENNVSLVPFTNNIQTYYTLSDVLIVCSGFETFGRVAVEAQKCSLPVILSNVGANPERIKDGINGLLYQKGDVDDLVSKIEFLRDKSNRNKFVQQINQLDLDKYSIVSFASHFYKLLKT